MFDGEDIMRCLMVSKFSGNDLALFANRGLIAHRPYLSAIGWDFFRSM
jgi:hypothetical protein